MSAADVRAFDDGDVEAAARAMSSTVPNSDGVLWVYDHEDGQQQPVTLKDAAPRRPRRCLRSNRPPRMGRGLQ